MTPEERYPPDGVYHEAEERCTCRPDCPHDCKGECGCKACDARWQDWLSIHG